MMSCKSDSVKSCSCLCLRVSIKVEESVQERRRGLWTSQSSEGGEGDVASVPVGQSNEGGVATIIVGHRKKKGTASYSHQLQ